MTRDHGQPQQQSRQRGFDEPLSTNQVLSWVGNGLATGGFYALCVIVLLRPSARCGVGLVSWMLVAHLVLVVLGFSCWMFLETHPPTQASCFGRWLPDSSRWTKKRYCREHRDMVVGLDHFCTWLNTAIGRENYVPFFGLALFGTLQYALHVAISIFVLVSCSRKDIGLALQFFFGLSALAGFLILAAYAALLSFHTYLTLFCGIGTYDWILEYQQADNAGAPAGSTHDR